MEAGELDPENIHVPGVYVHRLFKSDPNSPWSDVKIEKLAVKGHSEIKHFVSETDLKNGKVVFGDSPSASSPPKKNKNADPIRLKIAKRMVQ